MTTYPALTAGMQQPIPAILDMQHSEADAGLDSADLVFSAHR